MDSKIPGLACRVELLFEPLQVRERQASLGALVHKIVGPIEHHADADHATGFHLVEIARKRAADHRAERFGEGGFVGQRRQGLFGSAPEVPVVGFCEGLADAPGAGDVAADVGRRLRIRPSVQLDRASISTTSRLDVTNDFIGCQPPAFTL